MPTFNRKLIAAARSAGALHNVAYAVDAERTTEQQSAYAIFIGLCTAANVDSAAVYAAASVADTAKRTTSKRSDESTEAHKRANAETASKPGNAAKPDKPEAAPKAAKPSKPSEADAKRAADYAARVKLIGELRGSVSSLYNGPSLAVRTNPKRFPLSTYADLIASPKHRTTLDRVSERDESALFLILKRGTKTGGFDPVALNLDSGIFSRLCSVGYIGRDADGFTLTADALKHARNAAKRATAKAA